MNIAYIDVENSKTQEVITLELEIISNDSNIFEFSISNLDKSQLKVLTDAINSDLKYTDIEMFYVDETGIPYFGPDYNFIIQDEKLIGLLKTKNHTHSS